MNPSEAGHAYIAEQIYNALNIEYKILGDVNGDGLVDVEDLDKTGAWLNYIGKPDKYSKPFDKEIIVGLESYFKYQKKERWYGFLNYGDSHGERIWNWFNNEYDAAAILFEQASMVSHCVSWILFKMSCKCDRY